MSDLEITRLCALAMGYSWEEGHEPVNCFTSTGRGIHFDPLHDDAQAMALVKRFGLDVSSPVFETWTVSRSDRDLTNKLTGWSLGADAENADLNRAICECVAKMHKG